jgi:peptide/nickel transport system substrate-binding protein
MSATSAYASAAVLTGEMAAPVVQAQEPKMGGVLRIAMQIPEIRDPARVSWPEASNLSRHVFEHLTVTGPDNITRPHLCERWEPSEDLKVWTLYLRQGVKWNNGDDFTADDVVYNVQRWLDSGISSSNFALFNSLLTETDTAIFAEDGRPYAFGGLASGAVEKVDNHTVRLHLTRPELAIPEYLYHYSTAMVHRRFDDEGADINRHPVGTGPFLLEELSVGHRAVLAKRPPEQYWGREVYLDGISYLDHGDDPFPGLAALAAGQVDLIHEAYPEELGIIQDMPATRLYETLTAQTGIARMQVDHKPLDDVRVRTAIRLCQDHRQLLELAYRGYGVPAQDHHVAPIHPDYAPMQTPEQDHLRARKLLREAGYPNGIELPLDCRTRPSWEPAAARALAQMCRPAGIRINVNAMPDREYRRIWNTTPFGFSTWTHRPLGVMVLNLAYRSGAPWNETHYRNSEFDRVLDLANGTIDVVERRQHVAELQRMLQEDAVIAQPFWRWIFAAANNKVQGYELHPSNYHNLNKVWLA